MARLESEESSNRKGLAGSRDYEPRPQRKRRAGASRGLPKAAFSSREGWVGGGCGGNCRAFPKAATAELPGCSWWSSGGGGISGSGRRRRALRTRRRWRSRRRGRCWRCSLSAGDQNAASRPLPPGSRCRGVVGAAVPADPKRW